MKKAHKVALGLISVIAVLMGIVMALSPLAKWGINHYGKDWVGREMHANRVFINPLNSSVTISDFTLYEEDDKTVFTSFDRLYIRLWLPSLIHRELNVRALDLQGFNGSIVRYSDRFNFTSLVQKFLPTDDSKQEKDTTSSLWGASLHNIEVVDATLSYWDVVNNDTWEMENIHLNIPGISFGGEHGGQAGLEFAMRRGGTIGVQADYSMASNRYNISLKLNDVNAEVALPIVDNILNVGAMDGSLSGMVLAEGSLDRPDAALLKGHLCLEELDLRDDRSKSILMMDSLVLGLGRLNLATNRYALDTLILYGLEAHYEADKDSTTTFTRLIRNQEKATSDNKKQAALPLHVSAKVMQVVNARVSYRDKKMSPDFDYVVSQINISSKNFTNIGTNDIRISAQLGDEGQLRANYTGGLDVKQGTEKLLLQLQNVDVRDFSPYTETLMGYPLKKGLLSMRSETQLSNGQIASTNRIEIQDMEVGKKKLMTKAPYRSIPLRTGVGLLKSSKGLIVLDIPIAGDINSPKFNFRKVISRAVGKVFLGPLMGVAEKSELKEMLEVIDDEELEQELESELESKQKTQQESNQK